MKAAIYARYSSDQQRDQSVDDQIAVCQDLIARQGWTLAGTYADRAMSGSSHLRPGYQSLLADARSGKIDVVVAEALDRVSRDQEHVAAFFKQMQFCGIRIITLAEGEISELHVGLKGTMNALFLRDLAAKTHRGMRGRVAAGRSAGGICYGYRVRRESDAQGEPVRGGRDIEPVEAEVVRRIFAMFSAGASPNAIAKTLNGEAITGPGGGLGATVLSAGTPDARLASSATSSMPDASAVSGEPHRSVLGTKTSPASPQRFGALWLLRISLPANGARLYPMLKCPSQRRL